MAQGRCIAILAHDETTTRDDRLAVKTTAVQDGAGFRLGYGGGFYDRTLAVAQPRPLTIGVAYELSRVPTIHPQSFDLPMDYLVTERGIFQPGPAQSAT